MPMILSQTQELVCSAALYHWQELPQVFLLRQKICCDKQARVCRDKTHLLSRQKFCQDKIMFVPTKVLSRQNIFVTAKDVFCHDKHVFVATKMIHVTVPTNDSSVPERFCCFLLYFIVPCEKFRLPYLGKATASARAAPLISDCMQHFAVSKQWCGCWCLGFVTCAQMLMNAIAHRGCKNTIRKSAPKVDFGRKIPCRHWGIKPASTLCLIFLPSELSCQVPEMSLIHNARN